VRPRADRRATAVSPRVHARGPRHRRRRLPCPGGMPLVNETYP